MFKQSPSRNNRSKGIKVKHILQICVLLAVCIWLIYQVKHSHEKRKEFEVTDNKIVGKVQSDGDIQRFGRKDIPRITEIDIVDEKHEEDEDEKEDGEEEENKHEEDLSEKEDVRVVEKEDERGGGDDEIDEHEPEKTETESEHEDETVDEDKDTEEKEGVAEEDHAENEENEDVHEEGHPEKEDNEEDSGKEGHSESESTDDVDKDDHSEQEVTSDDQGHDVGRTNTREAQEELYKADDASSEVAQNVQSIIHETENVTSGHGNEMWGKINFGHDHENKTSVKAEELIKPKLQPREDVDIGTSNATVTNPKNYDISLTKPGESSIQNSILPKITSNSTVGGEHSASLISNETQMAFYSILSQNSTEMSGDQGSNLPGNVLEQAVKLELDSDDKSRQEALAVTNKTENVNINNGESLSSQNTTLASSNATDDIAAKDRYVGNEKQGHKSEISGEAGLDESSESHSDEGTDGIQHDPIDASDTTTLMQEEREIRTDLDTLPEIRTEIQNTEDAVAE